MSTSIKRGRPFKDNACRHDMKVRIDDKTHEKLLKYSKDNGITIAEAIRMAIKAFLNIKE